MIEISADSTLFAYPANKMPPYVNYNYCPHLGLNYSTAYPASWGVAGQRPVIGFDVVAATGVEELPAKEEALLLYPNPVKERVFFKERAKAAGYKIYNLSGLCVQSGSVTANGADVSTLPKGFYIVEIAGAWCKMVKE